MFGESGKKMHRLVACGLLWSSEALRRLLIPHREIEHLIAPTVWVRTLVAASAETSGSLRLRLTPNRDRRVDPQSSRTVTPSPGLDCTPNATRPPMPSITEAMETEPTQRPKWQVDHVLEALIGLDVRVRAKAFLLSVHDEARPTRWIRAQDLFLPDNSQTAGLSVFFEGRLRWFERHVGVVLVCLESSSSPDRPTEAPILFRGKTAVILRGPAMVELAFPFKVERLPADPVNYWNDLRVPRAQFELPFSKGKA
jgi:hypothetical protein